jgi:hypothetical protein
VDKYPIVVAYKKLLTKSDSTRGALLVSILKSIKIRELEEEAQIIECTDGVRLCHPDFKELVELAIEGNEYRQQKQILTELINGEK